MRHANLALPSLGGLNKIQKLNSELSTKMGIFKNINIWKICMFLLLVIEIKHECVEHVD